ncbi:helix-turn-helix domain-containing protein [Actinoplanes sp. CA-054009]
MTIRILHPLALISERTDQDRNAMPTADNDRAAPMASHRPDPHDGDRRKQARRFTKEELTDFTAAFTKQYERGSSLRSIAIQSGCSYSTVHRLLHAAGVPMRQHGGARPTPAVTSTTPCTS